MTNLELMRKRFEWQGGIEQENRMIQDKFRTFQKALKFSYQACTVAKVQSNDECLSADLCSDTRAYPPMRALINPDKVKQDYDDKIISIAYDSGFRPGDVFEWCKTDSKWIIYLEEITEDAYFRGEIRRCRYRIKFKDDDGKELSTYLAIRGPVETQIDSIQKNQERVDKPNLTLNMLLPLNPKTLRAFDRYKKFLFAGRCWEVQAPDSISMADGQGGGVLEINARESYINRETDDVVQEIKDGLVIEKEDIPVEGIVGNGFILPKMAEKYLAAEPDGTWKILECGRPVTLVTDSISATVTWNKVVSGQFTLQWSKGDKKIEKVIVVESLY